MYCKNYLKKFNLNKLEIKILIIMMKLINYFINQI